MQAEPILCPRCCLNAHFFTLLFPGKALAFTFLELKLQKMRNKK